MDEQRELAALNMISNVGMAKSLYIQAINDARNGCFDDADEKMKQGKDYYLVGHKAHAAQLSLEAEQLEAVVNLLFIHAEDQLASAELAEEMARQLIEVYKVLNKHDLLREVI